MRMWGWMDRNGYCWKDFPNRRVLGPGFARGPFTSMSAAIDDARRVILKDRQDRYHGEIAVGYVRYLDPAAYLPTVKDVLEEMESRADRKGLLDHGDIGDRVPFRSSDGRQSARALKAALTAWAQRWVEPRVWVMDRAVKTVKIR